MQFLQKAQLQITGMVIDNGEYVFASSKHLVRR